MIYLILSIISNVLIAVVIRVNEGRNLDRYAVMLFNYLVATTLSLIIIDRQNITPHLQQLAPLALFSSFCFVTAFLVYMKAVRHLGLAIPVTVTRLSVVIPVLGSILVFSEKINLYQGTGLFLALIAIYLFSWTGGVKTRTSIHLLTLLLFFLMGLGDFSLKVFGETFHQEQMMSFVLLVFAIASIYTLGLVTIKRAKLDRRVIMGGILLGFPNFCAAYFILKVLQVFPGATAFPINNIGIIMLSTLAGYFLWKERFHRRSVIAMLISIVAVILLNIDR
jgi:drug/metabolite transporter (DMT)-like permease